MTISRRDNYETKAEQGHGCAVKRRLRSPLSCDKELFPDRTAEMRIALVLITVALVGCSPDTTQNPAIGEAGLEGVVGRGVTTDSGTPWELSVRRSGEDQACMALTGGGEGCTLIPDGDRPLEVVFTGGRSDREGGYTCAFGMVGPIVATVEVLFVDGQQLSARLFPGQGWQVDFFAMCRGDDAVRVDRIVLLDSEGNALEEDSGCCDAAIHQDRR